MSRCSRCGAMWFLMAFVFAPSRAGAQAGPEGPAVARGVQYLKANGKGQQTGQAALAALALIKAGVPATDPDLVACLDKIRRRFNGSTFNPELAAGTDIYEASVVLMALANRDPATHRAEIQAAAHHILSKQKPAGCWDYDHRTVGDTSISQYAVLGLWEAENAGVPVPPRVWEQAALWYMATQRSSGAWVYHSDGDPQRPETVSMTAAGVGSLMICQRQLDHYRRATKEAVVNPLLTPLGGAASATPRYEVGLSVARVDAAIKGGVTWLARNWRIDNSAIMGDSPYYGLYGLERIGALGPRDIFGAHDWFDEGRRFLLSTQKSDGSWLASYNEVPNTAWAILFLTKSTGQTVAKFRPTLRLGAGTLLGGRGLPQDLNNLTVAQGRVVVRPMNGAIEGMLAVLEDPRAEQADEALAGLVARYRAEGAVVLRPQKARFRKLLADPDPGLRRVAAWALARTGDLDVVPVLIAALEDPVADVVTEARLGLQMLSRKLDGFGPPPGASPEQRREAARRWRDWYTAEVLSAEQ